MTKRYISFSQYKLFLSCSYRYYLSYILKYEEPKNEFLMFGKALHNSIEEIIKTKPIKILYEGIFTKHLKEQSNGTLITSYFGRNFIKQGGEILKQLSFFERYEGWEVIGVEKEINEPLCVTEDLEINFKGVIDLVLKKGDKYLILDWKTAIKPWNIDTKKQDKIFFGQLVLYRYFFSKINNIPIENIETRFVTLARDPIDIQQFGVNITKEFNDFILTDIVRVAKEIPVLKFESLSKAKHDEVKKSGCTYCVFNKKQCDSSPVQLEIHPDFVKKS